MFKGFGFILIIYIFNYIYIYLIYIYIYINIKLYLFNQSPTIKHKSGIQFCQVIRDISIKIQLCYFVCLFPEAKFLELEFLCS